MTKLCNGDRFCSPFLDEKLLYHANCILTVPYLRSLKSWWSRELTSEYLPPVSKSEPTLEQFLSHYELGAVSILK